MSQVIVYDKPDRSEEEVASAIRAKFPSVELLKVAPRRLHFRAPRESLFELCKFMRDELAFEHASCVTPVDYLDHFTVVYHISSWTDHILAEVQVDLPRDDPTVDSIAPLWGGANWHEREAYDLMGIVFKGHPDLRRIMLPEEFRFHPLRKDFIVGRRV
ncbi:MAG TPA: NADH-quinone oxidoreductase subunit C [Methanomassiliicoccales archaeon]|jgi:NADH-quinone oxidoreductase subunit C|nr:NADH-quinone oxidoreductase subunit C [Methanomassiliicoccales archaeon]MCE5261027.1 NADH-quinone oxidoreductase subunit C [Euryarchaeota archaeon]HOE52232.1 NADH-quinone oxidoreductase subunit C [Methanomassiliicoccales archaeon]HOO03547.1 NADH-quinone oxidoreductase subunit C [Methanomassiliicoccales archaeon]HPD08274.1 NADH-quinone oxidoreductase subunit C [Methanomassiliicoccales archaeon]